MRLGLICASALLAASCQRDALLDGAREENEKWRINSTEEIDENSAIINFSHAQFGRGTAYVNTQNWPDENLQDSEALDNFYSWANCYVDGAALRYELRELGMEGAGRWEVEQYCVAMQRQVRVEWQGRN